MRMHVKQRFLSLGDKYDIYDESDRPLFQVQGQVFSFGAKISVMKLAGQELFFIQQKVFRFLAEYHVYRGNDVCAVGKIIGCGCPAMSRIKSILWGFWLMRVIVSGRVPEYNVVKM